MKEVEPEGPWSSAVEKRRTTSAISRFPQGIQKGEKPLMAKGQQWAWPEHQECVLQGSQKQTTWDEDLVAGARVLEAWLTVPGWIPLCPHVVCVMQTVVVLTYGVLDTCLLRCWGPAPHPTNPKNCL